jgi:hypothetical protein
MLSAGKCSLIDPYYYFEQGFQMRLRMHHSAHGPVRAVRGNNLRPLPVFDFRHVTAMGGDVLPVLNVLIAHALFERRRALTELGHTVNYIHDQAEAVEVIAHHHIEWRTGTAFFLVAAHMQIVMVGAAVSQAMNQPRVAVVGEDDRLISSE